MQKPWLLLFLVLIIVAPLKAQDFRMEAVPNPSVVITDIEQDCEGFLWFAGTGLHRYDGYTYKTFQHVPGDTTSLTANSVSNLLVDSDCNLWVAVERSEVGFYRFDFESESFIQYPIPAPDSIREAINGVFFLEQDIEGRIWLGTHQGHLIRFNRESGNFVTYTIPGSPAIVEHILEDSKGNLWVATSGALFIFDRSLEQFEEVIIEDPDSPGDQLFFFSLFEDRRENFWVGLNKGRLVRLDRESGNVSVFRYNQNDVEYSIEDILEDQFGNLWIGTWGGGLFRFNRDLETFECDLCLSRVEELGYTPNAYRIFLDRMNIMWAAMIDANGRDRNQGLLLKWSPALSPFSVYTLDALQSSAAFPRNNVHGFHEDADGQIVVLAGVTGLQYFNPDTEQFAPLSTVQGASDRPVMRNPFAIIPETNDTYLVAGSRPSLLRVDAMSLLGVDSQRDLDTLNAMIPGGVLDVVKDQQGGWWFATYNSGLIHYDPEAGHYTAYTNNSDNEYQFKGQFVYDVHEDRKGNIWVGALQDGMEARVGSLQRYNREEQRFEQYTQFGASSIFESRDGTLFVRSNTQGLFEWNPQTGVYTQYDSRSGLLNNNVGCVIEDDEGALWIATQAGLSRFDRQTKSFSNFPFAELPNEFAFSGIANACYRDSGGALYFGGVNKILVIDPTKVTINEVTPEVEWVDLTIADEPVSYKEGTVLNKPINHTDEIVLKHYQNNFAIQFAGLHFENPLRNRYRFRLENYNDDWTETGSERWARFFQMSPGQYRLHVQAANAQGYWNYEGKTLAITIQPPWWQTWPAYLLYALLFMGAVLGAYRVQYQRIVRREREQNLIEKSRLEREAALERARFSEDLANMKTRFFLNVSHELRTPLTLLLGPISDAINGRFGEMGSTFKRQLHSMERNGIRLKALINQLLDVEKIKAGRLELKVKKIDLAEFLSTLLLSFYAQAEREKKTLEFGSVLKDQFVYADPTQLETAVQNLLSNAFKFTSTGDTITVSMAENEDCHIIKVQDNGCGVAEKELDRIFDRFYQVNTRATEGIEGTGIGLSLARELIQLHKGDIRVESEYGIGSVFSIALRKGKAHFQDIDSIDENIAVSVDSGKPHRTQHTAAIKKAAALLDKDTAKILIVEDNQDLRAYLKMHLEGYAITEAQDGLEGLKLAKEILPDLVISDVMMPAMDGITLCKSIRDDEATQDIPVILLTAKAMEESKIEGLRSGADDYIYKPFSAKELLSRTENLIDQRKRLRRHYRKKIVLKPADIQITSEEAQFVEQVKSIVEQHMGNSMFGVGMLAYEMNQSRRQLQRKMNNTLQQTASSFIRDLRLERAMQLLQKNKGTVSEIAYAVGYNDPHHFTRLFRKKFDQNPSEVRSLNSQNNA